jgi:stress response protein YsnF
MADLDIDTALDWRGRTVVDRHGNKIGTLKEIYLDEDERPHWGGVDTAPFGLRQTLVPLDHGALDGDRLRLPFDADHVKSAPSVDPDVQLTEDQADRLYRHYGLSEPPDTDTDTGAANESRSAQIDPDDDRGKDAAIAAGQARAASDDRHREPDASAQPRPTATPAAENDDAMTRSEEEVHIGTRRRPRERIRIKKYVVTDHVEKTIPVKREEVRLERESPEPPPDKADTAHHASTGHDS